MHGSLERRDIDFRVIVSGNAANSLRKNACEDLKRRPDGQHIWFTNSRAKAEGGLRNTAETLLEENRIRENNPGPNSVPMPFVGTDGIMMKTTTMDAVKMYADLDGEGTMLDPSSYREIAEGRVTSVDGNEVALPKIQIILATKSAEAGINGRFLEF